MKILLHSCCGPCTIYPYQQLEEEGFEVTAYFHNPNIHPFREFKLRLSTFREYTATENIKNIIDNSYGLQQFVRKIAFNENKKCLICYKMRIENVALIAFEKGFDAFTTSLLYSKYQKHNKLREICNKISDDYKIPFVYRDFREGWQYGIEQSILKNMYRQPYCGCVFSEHERYDKKLRKKK